MYRINRKKKILTAINASKPSIVGGFTYFIAEIKVNHMLYTNFYNVNLMSDKNQSTKF